MLVVGSGHTFNNTLTYLSWPSFIRSDQLCSYG